MSDITMTPENEAVKNKVKDILKQLSRREELVKELAVINAELAEYGLENEKPKAGEATRSLYKLQESDIPKLKTFCGSEGKTFGEIGKEFKGNHLNAKKFVSDHLADFTVKGKKVSAKH